MKTHGGFGRASGTGKLSDCGAEDQNCIVLAKEIRFPSPRAGP